uniref:Uncharacterized protein n=1 Tax=Brassica oleracea TaxID=3712 RepID=A0A3P6CSA2_BRAOL|nr:unnamed protein product [Brassica oleracea]
MMSTLASSVHRLAPPPSVQIFVVSGPWLEPTGSVPFSGGSRKARSSSTAAHSYTISFHSCTLLFSSRSLCSSAPVNRLEPDKMLRQSHSYSQQHLLLTSAPEMASSVSGIPHLIRRAVQKARGTMRLCFPLHALIIITPLGAYLGCYSARASVLSKATSLLRSALLRKPFTPMRPASAPPRSSSPPHVASAAYNLVTQTLAT